MLPEARNVLPEFHVFCKGLHELSKTKLRESPTFLVHNAMYELCWQVGSIEVHRGNRIGLWEHLEFSETIHVLLDFIHKIPNARYVFW